MTLCRMHVEETYTRPFSCVQIDRVAELIDLDPSRVEKKLAQMILDKKLQGVLAQGEGQLVLHSPPVIDPVYAHSLEVIKNMGQVVDSLFKRAETLDVGLTV
jgi:26S proteasome regulatory subunit N6